MQRSGIFGGVMKILAPSIPTNSYPTLPSTIAISSSVTASRAIPWWDTPVYALAAYTLGVVHPPGSLLLTILGWLVTRVLGPPDFILSLTAGAIGVITIGVNLLAAKRVLFEGAQNFAANFQKKPASVGFLSLGVVLLGSASTLWQYRTKFTPYILTACFTALILWALVRWKNHLDDTNHFTWLFIVGLLVGLDFSVHRTNLLLIPGIIAWILIFRPKVLLRWKTWSMLIAGGVLGLLFHLLLIPMAAADPALNFTNPNTLSRFWDYVALEQYGGSFLVDLFPRTAPFWAYQVMDFLDTFAANFFPADGPLGWVGILPGLLGFFGFGVLFKQDWRTAAGTVGLFGCMSLVAVLYFNLPENYIRPISRHYLPSFVLFGFWMLYGTGFLGREIHRRFGTIPVLAAGVIVITGITGSILRNYPERDMSQHRFAEDFARNMLRSLPQNAILFTNGDADTFPLWYLQGVEGYRQDITVCNIYLLMTPWFPQQILRRNLDFPMGMTAEEIENLQAISWTDSTVRLPGDPNPVKYGLGDTVDMPDSVMLNVPPTFGQGNLFIHDQVLLSILKANRWKRPVYVSIGVGQSTAAYLTPYLRLEGLVRRAVPTNSVRTDAGILKANLVEKYRYNGFDDSTVPIDAMTNWAAQNYYTMFLQLIREEQGAGRRIVAQTTLDDLETKIPPDRIALPESVTSRIDSLRQVLAE